MSDIIKGANVTNEKVTVGPKSNKKVEDRQIDPQKAAELKSEEMLESARKEAKKIVEEAKLKSKEIRDEAREVGYRKGIEKAKVEWNSNISRLKEMINLMETRIDSSIDKLKPSLIELSIAVIKETVFSETNHGEISKKINHALDMVKSSKKILLKISNNVPQEIANEFSKIEKLQVITDSSLEDMDVQIEVDFGSLDLRVKSQMEVSENLVRKSFGTST